jgi:hypothetical protein
MIKNIHFGADLGVDFFANISNFGCSKNNLAVANSISGRLQSRTAPSRIRSRVIKLDRSNFGNRGFCPGSYLYRQPTVD